jgi:hypothetical protein
LGVLIYGFPEHPKASARWSSVKRKRIFGLVWAKAIFRLNKTEKKIEARNVIFDFICK